MNKINELRDYLLENYVDERGDLDITYLDFGEFDGDVYISGMKVQGNLYQSGHDVEGTLYQSRHYVKGNLYQAEHDVDGDYYSSNIYVAGVITFKEPKKSLKEITAKELEKMGYKIKEKENEI